MSYIPQTTGGTPGWNDPPQIVSNVKPTSGLNRKARPVDPSCQSAPVGYTGQMISNTGYGGSPPSSQPQQQAEQPGVNLLNVQNNSNIPPSQTGFPQQVGGYSQVQGYGGPQMNQNGYI